MTRLCERGWATSWRCDFDMILANLRHRPFQSLIVCLGLTVALTMPLFTAGGVSALEQRLMARAVDSPVLFGRRGSPTDLVLSALWFRGQASPMTWADHRAVAEAVDGEALPLHLGHTAQGRPLVGTSVGYLAARGLELSEGRRFAVVGEVVAGSETGLQLGDALRTDVASLYDVQQAALLVEVVGVLAPSAGPDDEALFGALATSWAVSGLLHGHDEGDGAPSVFLFDRPGTEFHGHGLSDDFPVHATLVMPDGVRARDEALTLGTERIQALQPERQVRELMAVVLRVRQGLHVLYAAVALSTLLLVLLVGSLSVRLRRDEVVLLKRLGASRGQVFQAIGGELLVLTLLASVLAVALSALLVKALL